MKRLTREEAQSIEDLAVNLLEVPPAQNNNFRKPVARLRWETQCRLGNHHDDGLLIQRRPAGIESGGIKRSSDESITCSKQPVIEESLSVT